MKLFISWSGAASRHVGRALHAWLPDVLQAVEPWMSDNSIDKGSRWNVELSRQLEEVDQGIVCVTSGNLREPWLNYEAGALAKSLSGQVRPVLLDLEPAELTGPLASFQTTKVHDRDDMSSMVGSINAGLPNPLSDERLERQFDFCWRRLEAELSAAPTIETSGTGIRSTDDMISEMLTIIRQLARSASAPTLAGHSPWQKAARSQAVGGGIEVAPAGDQVVVRDAKNPEGGTIAYSAGEFAAFLDGAKRGEFDHLT